MNGIFLLKQKKQELRIFPISAKGFKGLKVFTVDGTNFKRSYDAVKEGLKILEIEKDPY